MRLKLVFATVGIASLAACADDERPPPTSPDASSPRADARASDAFAPDAAPSDDAFVPIDLGAPGDDLGVPDDDAGFEADASEPPDLGAPEPTCPPSGPFGTEVGDTAPDVVLLDCEGNPHRIHDLCSRNVSWIFEFTGW